MGQNRVIGTGKSKLAIKMPNKLDITVIARARAEFPQTSCNYAKFTLFKHIA